MSYFANFNPARVARALLQLVGRYGSQDQNIIATVTRGLIHPVTGEVAYYVGTDGMLKSATTDLDLVRYTTGTISNSEMLALRATPKTLVPAPGAGYVLEFVSIALYFDWTGGYTESNDDMVVRYGDGSGAAASDAIDATNFLTATADTRTTGRAKADQIASRTGCENKALVLHNGGDGEYGGGNAANVIRFKVAYRIQAASW